MDPLAELRIIESIRRLKARYFRAIDAKDWPTYRSLFTADARLDVRGEAHDGQTPPIVEGGDRITGFVSGQLEGVTTVHQGHMGEIDVLAEDVAHGVWALHDILIWPEGAPIRRLEGYGHYHEDYRCEGGEWRIASLRLARTHVELNHS